MKEMLKRISDAYFLLRHGRYYIWSLYNKELDEREMNKYIPEYNYFLEDNKILWRTESLQNGGVGASEWICYPDDWRWMGSYFGEFGAVKNRLSPISKHQAQEMFPEAVQLEKRKEIKLRMVKE